LLMEEVIDRDQLLFCVEENTHAFLMQIKYWGRYD